MTGKRCGSKVSNSIEDAALNTCRVVDGYYLFSVDKIVVKFPTPPKKNDPLMPCEVDGILQLAEILKETTSFVWGISAKESKSIDVIVEMFDANGRTEQLSLKIIISDLFKLSC